MCAERSGREMRCLYIDDIASERRAPSESFLLNGRRGDASGESNLWERLMVELQSARSGSDILGIVARGTGCAAALALAEQLPVDRLVLYAPRVTIPVNGDRQARRMAAYARRNLSLCVADTLIIEHDRTSPRLSGWNSHCRVTRLALSGKGGDELYTIREIASKSAVSCFLRTGELPKKLAQNPEMCIIDG